MKRDIPFRLTASHIVAVCVLGLGHLKCAMAQDIPDLTNLVGADVGLCLEVSELKNVIPQLESSTLQERLLQMDLVKTWLAGEDFKKLKDGRSLIELIVRKPLRQIVNDLFGESVIVAVYPQSNGEPVGVLLTKAANIDVLNELISIWNRLDQPVVTELRQGEKLFYCRSAPQEGNKPRQQLYYVTFGRVFAVSDHEATIRRVIDLSQKANDKSDTTSLRTAAVYQQATAAIRRPFQARLFLNPRPWDSRVLSQSGLPPIMATLWQSLESLTVGLDLSHGVIFEAVARYNAPPSYDAWQEFVSKTEGPCRFLDRVPQDAMIVAAGRYDPRQIGRMASAIMSTRDQRKFQEVRRAAAGLLLGADPLDDLLPALGTNWAAFVVPASRADSESIPALDGLIALELPDNDAALPNTPSFRTGLDNLLNTGLNVLGVFVNGKQTTQLAVVRTRGDAESMVRWVDRIGTFRPGYALTSDALVLFSTPTLVPSFRTASTPTLSADSEFHRLARDVFPDANQVLYFNLAGFRAFVSKHRAQLLQQAIHTWSLNAAAAEHRLTRLEDVLSVFDSAFLTARITDDQIRLIAGAQAQTER